MAQQLQFGGEGVEEGRVMELATRVEDLIYCMRNDELEKHFWGKLYNYDIILKYLPPAPTNQKIKLKLLLTVYRLLCQN